MYSGAVFSGGDTVMWTTTHCQALTQDQISTSPRPRTVDAQHGHRTNIITYIVNIITINSKYKPNLTAFLLKIINVYLQ